ncbi:MAG: FKBP-type peptidyl-prolyl cis-trans isomerase [Crocinitomicaceae bacterium]|nr:FKBP-type peptidyl-prolyl cis-trans isomerase [Crocinitomicaceae bacterium]
MKHWLILIATLTLVSCSDKDEKRDTKDVEITANNNSNNPNKNPTVIIDSNTVDFEADRDIVDEKEIKGGLNIKWYEHGEGEQVKAGDMVNIDYKVYLENGEVIDGNHLRQLASFPFMVGFQMQKEGWDNALKELRIGDFAEIFIPASEIRGNKEIEGLIPKNSNNILKIRILSFNEPTRVIDGTRIWLMNENKANTNLFGETNRISFHCWVSSPSNPLYFNTEWENNPYGYGLGDGGLVPGLRKALINAKKADLMFVHVPSKEAYGAMGYQDLVKPNEDLLYRVFVMAVTE